jgi:site-specific recombinase XerD
MIPRASAPSAAALATALVDVLDEMIAAKRVQGRSEKLLVQYRYTVGKFIAWLEERGTPATIDALVPRTVRLFLGWVAERHASPQAGPWQGTVRPFGSKSLREWTITLKTLSKWAWREEVTEIDQLARLALPPRERKVLNVFTDAQLTAILEQAAKDPRWYAQRNVALLLFLLDSLARVSEAASLTLDRLV